MLIFRNPQNLPKIVCSKKNLPSLLQVMAKSKFEYVRNFEEDRSCLPNCWIVIRLDGKGFHRFANIHKFRKPNDERALDLMNRAAASVLEEFRDISLAYGQSDEYSFVFRKSTKVYNRRYNKLLTLVSSLFASSYVFYWKNYFKETHLIYPPSFDARAVLYPSDKNLRDYLSWRQADVHVNNLYNTCFWSLVLKKNLEPKEAEETLKGTLANEKNELLFQEFKINYNNEPKIFRKGTTLIRKQIEEDQKLRHVVIPLNCDIIGERFWAENSEILSENQKLPVISNIENIVLYHIHERATLEKRIETLPDSKSESM